MDLSLNYLIKTLNERFNELSEKNTKQIDSVIEWIAILYTINEAIIQNDYKTAYLYLQSYDVNKITKGFWRDSRKDKVLEELKKLNLFLSYKTPS
jgi:hypothetical protein